MIARNALPALGWAVAAAWCVSGCAIDPDRPSGASDDAAGDGEPTSAPAPVAPSPTKSEAPPEERLASDGRARLSWLSIPAIGLAGLRVVPYVGSPDDAPGTRIQDGGVAATPGGPDGGTGPGGIGNFIVTAHRTSSTRAFARLPELRNGHRVHVRIGQGRRAVRHTYEIVRTRQTSFRSALSLARQSAPVPGRPGAVASRAMITLSTCATPEDHARGNFWADEFGNPEHRIDKVGVLVDVDRG